MQINKKSSPHFRETHDPHARIKSIIIASSLAVWWIIWYKTFSDLTEIDNREWVRLTVIANNNLGTPNIPKLPDDREWEVVTVVETISPNTPHNSPDRPEIQFSQLDTNKLSADVMDVMSALHVNIEAKWREESDLRRMHITYQRIIGWLNNKNTTQEDIKEVFSQENIDSWKLWAYINTNNTLLHIGVIVSNHNSRKNPVTESLPNNQEVTVWSSNSRTPWDYVEEE